MHRIGVPELCWYEEICNSDSTFYGGSNLGNGPGRMAEAAALGRPPVLDPDHAAAAGRRDAQAAQIGALELRQVERFTSADCKSTTMPV